jgi:lipopolysaccharide transport system permease protein
LNKLYKHKDLLFELIKREIRTRYKGSQLGQIWSLISPLLFLIIYTVIFGVIFKSRFGILKDESIYDFSLTLFLGLSIFNSISESINSSPQIIVNNPNYVKKVIFPIELLNVSNVITSLYYTVINILIITIIEIISQKHLSLEIVFIPLLIIPIFFISLGLSLILSTLGVFIKDISHSVVFISTLILYGSAVVYPVTRISDKLWRYMKYNPILLIINETRNIILWDKHINWYSILYIYVSSIIILIIGYLFFNKYRVYFAEFV